MDGRVLVAEKSFDMRNGLGGVDLEGVGISRDRLDRKVERGHGDTDEGD